MEQDITFDFENDLQEETKDDRAPKRPILPTGEIGQQPKNFVKNFKKTVCLFWIKGMCMKGDNCGFLHEMIPERMPECTNFLKKGVCNDRDCPFKHSKEGILECNMYALGFCIYGPDCRYKHTRRSGPPPEPSTVEAAKPKAFRDINRVVNSVNKNVVADMASKRPRLGPTPRGNAQALPNSRAPAPRPPSAPPPDMPVGGRGPGAFGGRPPFFGRGGRGPIQGGRMAHMGGPFPRPGMAGPGRGPGRHAGFGRSMPGEFQPY